MLRKRIEKKDKNTNVSLKPQGSFCLSGFHYCSFGHTQTHQESSSHLSLSSLSLSLSHVFFIFVLFAGTIISKTIHEFHISFAFFNLFYSFCHYQIVLSVLKFTFFSFSVLGLDLFADPRKSKYRSMEHEHVISTMLLGLKKLQT